MKISKAIISGGGTGGHIFPAVSIANEIRRRNPDAEILFVGASGRMEMEKVPAAGYKIIGLPVMGFPRKPGFKTLVFFIRLIKSALMARKIVRNFNPQIAIGVGGYASGPLLRAASAKNIPCLIQEQNSYAGITNKLLSKKVARICVAYDSMENYFPKEKIIFTGNPVRGNLLENIPQKPEALAFFGFQPDMKTILIIGGSLGAKTLNLAVSQNLASIAASGYSFIWQTGSLYFDALSKELRDKIPANLKMYKFLDRMDMAYSAADLIVSRAGAGTISELCLVGKPSILVPSPNVAEDHQTKNAMQLAEKNAAIMIKDNEIGEKLLPEIARVMTDTALMESLSKNIKLLAKPNATQAIVDETEKLLDK